MGSQPASPSGSYLSLWQLPRWILPLWRLIRITTAPSVCQCTRWRATSHGRCFETSARTQWAFLCVSPSWSSAMWASSECCQSRGTLKRTEPSSWSSPSSACSWFAGCPTMSQFSSRRCRCWGTLRTVQPWKTSACRWSSLRSSR